MTTLYISGAMTLHGPENNWGFDGFDAAAKQLQAVGFSTENPADKGIIEGWEWADYLKYDLKKLLDCDGVATLDDWIYSAGAQLEVHTAKRVSIPVFSVQEWLDRSEA